MSSHFHCYHEAPIFYLFLASAFLLVPSIPISSLNSSQPGWLPSGNIATTLLAVYLAISTLSQSQYHHRPPLCPGGPICLCFQIWISWPPCPLEELNWNQVALFHTSHPHQGWTYLKKSLFGTKLSEVFLLWLNITGFKHSFNESINGLLRF